MKIFVCQVCGHIEFEAAPSNCPVCWAPKDKFVENDKVFVESKEKSPEAEVKHIPALKTNKTCGLIPEESCYDVIIRIGETLHPMEEKHFIHFVDCYLDNNFVERIHFTPAVNPAACLHLKTDAGKVTVVSNCNIHGYWQTEISF